MEKKGQVSIYIIIGLVILISFMLLMYFKGVGNGINLDDTIEDVPVSFKPVKNYVEYNLKVSLTQAIKNLGQHAGYVDPYSYSLPPNLEFPTESSALKPFSNSNRIYPYWYFMDSPNLCESCTFKTMAPPLKSIEIDGAKRANDDNSIEAQIDRYLKRKMENLDFTDFKFENFDVAFLQDLEITTTITNNIVNVKLYMPMLVEKDEESFKLTQFKAELPVEFPRVYELAREITLLEKETKFIEEHVVNLISTYSGVAKERLPIMGSDFRLEASPIYWKLDEVKEQIVDEVLSKVSGLRIEGTSNFGTGAIVSDFEDIEVFFTFPDTKPFFFQINNLERGIVGPETITHDLIIAKMIFNYYTFSYDVSFPVLVTLRLLNGLDGEDYTFQFALEGNIRANAPLYEGTNPLNPAMENTMMCDSGQALSGKVTIRTQTNDYSPLNGVDLFYNCADQACYIGKSDTRGILKTNLPVCVGGFVVPVKPQFIGEPVEFDSGLNKGGDVSVRLTKTKSFEVEVKKLVFTQDGNKWPNQKSDFSTSKYVPTIKELEDDESVILMFRRIGDLSSYKFPAEVRSDGAVAPVYLADGEYEVDMLLLKNKELVMPAKTCPDITILPCTEYDEAVFEEMQYGGGKIGSFKLNSNDMQKDKLTLYTLYFDMFSIDDFGPKDLQVIGELDEYAPYLIKNKPVVS